MPAILTYHAYGKSQVQLTKVTRTHEHHDLKELSINIQLEGDFQASYTLGDNSKIIPTDTMKNMVYALARTHPLTDIESFGQTLAAHFLDSNSHVLRATVGLLEHAWRRIMSNGTPHPHAFIAGGKGKRTATVDMDRAGTRIESGIEDISLLKTTNSAFAGFLRCPYTTLQPADDRILATDLSAKWLYRNRDLDWTACHQTIRHSMLEAFANHRSMSIQQTLHVMAEAALDACAEIAEITLTMPNRHRLLVDLTPFGLDNPNEIFVATEEPFGLITATLARGGIVATAEETVGHRLTAD
jgi:urate oxidase